jgi:predicted nucleic acid-binding protein
MMLTDAGPLVAVFDKRDGSHAICLEIVKNIKTPFITIMPVVTEAFYLLRYSWHTQNKLWEAIEQGLLRIYNIDAKMLRRCRELMGKYHDLPMDFADASLVAVAEKENISKIFTLDHKDFKVYRTKSNKSFRLLPSKL